MFDEITCDYALPDTQARGEVFQTKSLECAMLHYTISAEVRLIWHQVRYEEVPEEEHPYDGKPE